MSRHLTFKFEPERFVHASAYLVQRCPEVTKMKLCKLLYYADKEHLLDYGRPIIGDKYTKMELGPVPSQGYNIVKHDDRAPVEDQELFDAYIVVDGRDLALKRPPNLDFLSESDVEALDTVIGRFGHLTASQLSKLSHHEASWKMADMNNDMDYRLFFVNRPGSEDVKRLVLEDQELRDALDDIELEELYGVLLS